MSVYRFPLRQHIGKEAVPKVTEGCSVVRGQLLAAADPDAPGAPVHSSISGVVTEVNAHEITVEKGTEADPAGYLPLQQSDPLERIRGAGIVGLGGAGFPTYAKLCTPVSGGTVILNAAECEPILEHNMARIRTSAKEIIQGLEIVRSLVHARQSIIAIKKKRTAEREALSREIRSSPVDFCLLPDAYPAGEERAVIREALGTLLLPEALPAAAGAIVLNTETVYRIYEAVVLGKPLIDRDVTIAGKIHGNHSGDLIQVFPDQPLGISTEALFHKAGGLADEYGELIAGGPFTGKRTAMDAPLIKTTGALIATECFPRGAKAIGLLVCACGADETRLRQLAESLGSSVAGTEFCKQAKAIRGTRKCENPGHCPGQAQKVMALKKAGAQAVLISSCIDCTNTVMACAPALGLPVYHCTDQALRAVNHPLIRRIREN